jgi:hypothetical protein
MWQIWTLFGKQRIFRRLAGFKVTRPTACLLMYLFTSPRLMSRPRFLIAINITPFSLSRARSLSLFASALWTINPVRYHKINPISTH